MVRFICDEFPGDDTDWGCYHFVYPKITVNDSKIEVEVETCNLLDEMILSHYIKIYNGFLLCFALDDLSSFQALPDSYDHLLRVKNMEKPPIILVGTKSDIEDSKRKVTKEEAKEYASLINCEYFEVSSLTTSNVKEAYQCIIQKTYDYLNSKLLLEKPKQKQEKKKSSQEKCLI